MTPFIALYGYHPPSITSFLRENFKVQAVEYYIEHQQQVLQLLKDNLTLAQNQMEQQTNQHRNEISFDVSNWIFLWLQPYKQMSLEQVKKDNKLSPVLWSLQGVAKYWYYGIQSGASCIFPSAPIFPSFMLKEGYR